MVARQPIPSTTSDRLACPLIAPITPIIEEAPASMAKRRGGNQTAISDRAPIQPKATPVPIMKRPA